MEEIKPTSEVKPELEHPPSHASSKPIKKVLLGFLAFFLLAGLAYGAYSLGQQSAPPEPTLSSTPSNSTQTDPTANWKTYTNTRYGYLVKYPSDVTYTEDELKEFAGLRVGDAGEITSDIKTSFKFNGGTLEIAGNVGGRGANPKKEVQIIIAGIATSKYYESDTAGVIKSIDSPKNDEIFFSFTLPSNPQETRTVDATFDQILSTFKFTDQSESWILLKNTNGFSLKYPSDMKVLGVGMEVDETTAPELIISKNPDNRSLDTRFHLTVEKKSGTVYKDLSLEEIARENYEANLSNPYSSAQSIKTLEKTMLDNHEAYTYTIRSNGFSGKWTGYAKNTVENMTVIESEYNGRHILIDYSSDNPIFNEILSSLKLTP